MRPFIVIPLLFVGFVSLFYLGWRIAELIFHIENEHQRSPRWGFMRRLDIPPTGEPYLKRLRLVQTPWFGVYVHKMLGPDPLPVLHDHPWTFLSLILRGSYREAQRYEGSIYFYENRKWFNFKRAEDSHFISQLNCVPTWTLVFVGPRRRDWGFIERDGTWTPWDLFEERKAS